MEAEHRADVYGKLPDRIRRKTPVLGTELAELDYEEIFKCLPKEKQEEIMEKQNYFREKSMV